MSGFSPEWLALREPVDHRSRDAALAEALAHRFAGSDEVTVVDLGCGAGSNIRATFRLLPPRQSWVLVDYDARLLEVARERLTNWSDAWRADGDLVRLRKDGKALAVTFRQADLNSDLPRALGSEVDLVTAAALFDLCSRSFIERFAQEVAARGAAFYTVLTYNGEQRWQPPHDADAAMVDAFHRHQRIDKGFGAAAGPEAPTALAEAFKGLGYAVQEGDSPWRLDAGDARLLDELARGFVAAVAETGAVAATTIAAWSAVQRSGCTVGHTDTLAVPRAA